MMDDAIISYEKRPDLNSPVLIEGLPGVGNVGKLAAEHLIDEMGFTIFSRIYSKHLPPQVMVDEEGLVELVNHALYYRKGEKGQRDMMVLTGDFQGLTPEGQYVLSEEIVKLAEELGTSLIMTLGGFGMIRMVEEPSVLGAVTDPGLRGDFEKLGVTFRKGEPSSGIIGASGLLLGLGGLRGIPGICLMGETSGYFADPKSARAILEVVSGYLGITIDMAKLEEKAKQVDELTSRLRKDLEESEEEERRSEDLRYFG